ncbi:hypothetical protein SLEP1_g5679 [Rubroshorea leprosula]|uniref:Uncharacterized protein n=1 Tax=Rubroshorea leprosula TaxID=152421 RepID=A0AAV5HYM7_9ROSI|nr:hypothetical protein SLEP1_g5679 [Rubroshorea leprosula]
MELAAVQLICSRSSYGGVISFSEQFLNRKVFGSIYYGSSISVYRNLLIHFAQQMGVGFFLAKIPENTVTGS